MGARAVPHSIPKGKRGKKGGVQMNRGEKRYTRAKKVLAGKLSEPNTREGVGTEKEGGGRGNTSS